MGIYQLIVNLLKIKEGLYANMFGVPSSNSSQSYIPSPGQPVVDLENYLQALEKKHQYVQKLIQKLDAKKSDEACSRSLVSNESRLQQSITSNPWPMISIYI